MLESLPQFIASLIALSVLSGIGAYLATLKPVLGSNSLLSLLQTGTVMIAPSNSGKATLHIMSRGFNPNLLSFHSLKLFKVFTTFIKGTFSFLKNHVLLKFSSLSLSISSTYVGLFF